MGVDVRYMGTKRQLAPVVSQVIDQAQPGPMLDAFSGMCAIGCQVAPRRQIWSNDAQEFAYNVATALFCSSDNSPPDPQKAWITLFPYFEKNRSILFSRFNREIEKEYGAISSNSSSLFIEHFESYEKKYEFFDSERLSARKEEGAYRLFSITYAGGFFSLCQAIDIDSIRCSIDAASRSGEITEDAKRWLLIALGRAALQVSTTTGHFAQYLKPREDGLGRFIRQRRRSVRDEFIGSLQDMSPSGTSAWRKKNRSFNDDSISLLEVMVKSRKKGPSVIYADPPYTNDQYSRYYHVLETLIRYDYPEVFGKGRYRPDRFVTSFSLSSKAVEAFGNFMRLSSRLGADLVLSYPENGLLHKLGVKPEDVLRKYYSRVEVCDRLAYEHSTMGASKGAAKTDVTEVIYWGRA